MDDAALAVALAANDPDALDETYRRYSDRLFAYAATIVGDRETAADVVHDAFLLAGRHAGRLRDPARLRPWLYAITRNVGLRQLRQRARTRPVESFDEMTSELTDPLDRLHAAETAELVWAAYAGLAPADREIVELAVRHGLSSTDISTTLAISVKHANARLSRARASFADSLGVLLVARSAPDCSGLADLLRGWDGVLTPLLRKRLHRHIEDCRICGEERGRRMDPAALLSVYAGLPFPQPPPPRQGRRRGSRLTGTVIGSVLLLLVICGTAAALPGVPAPRATSPEAYSSAARPSPQATGPGQPDPVSPSPLKSLTPTSTPEPLVLSLDGSLTCTVNNYFRLRVRISADTPLSTATLRWRRANYPGHADMALAASKLEGSATGTGLPTGDITWWVEATAVDGRSTRTEDVSSHNPC